MAEHPAEDVCCALKSMFNLLETCRNCFLNAEFNLEAVKTVRILAN